MKMATAAWKETNPQLALEALAVLIKQNDQRSIEKTALKSPVEPARFYAVQCVGNDDVLYKIVKKEASERVVEAALARMKQLTEQSMQGARQSFEKSLGGTGITMDNIRNYINKK